MAGTTSNKFIPILGIITIAIVIVVVYRQFTSDRPSDSNPLTRIPTPDAPQQLPGEAGADNDTQAETLRTVAVSNEKLRADVAQVLELNKKLQEENRRLGSGFRATGDHAAAREAPSSSQTSIDPVGQEPLAHTSPDTQPGMVDRANAAMGSFAEVLQMNASPTRAVTDTERANANRARPQARATGSGVMAASAGTQGAEPGSEDGERMRTLVPMGYSAVIDAPAKAGAQGNAPAMTRYVRTSGNESYSAVARMSAAGAAAAAQTAAAAPSNAAHAAAKAQPVPYFTVPENSTLVGVTSMTSIIGRVPIDGRVTDPMQFKAIVGRDNLAANGFELPPDLEGMIVTGIAIGDMALSCSEGKVRSITFVFNDGTVRTVSTHSRAGGGSSASASASGQDLGFISDEYGNPCVPGQFVTNAPAYLADIALIKGLDVAASAYADAQRTVSSNLQTGSTTSQVTGNTGGYAMAQAASGAADELVQWMTSRMKNSFDAVVTPAGRSLVIHVDKELQIDKMPDARKLVYRQQGGRQTVRGEHYGLE